MKMEKVVGEGVL